MNRTSAKGWEKEVSRLVVSRIAQDAWETNVSDVTISDSLQARIERLWQTEREQLDRRKIRRRVAVILIAALLAALTACMSISAVREKLYEIAVTFYEKYFTYQSVPAEMGKTSDGGSGTGVVFEKRLPTYLPEGYELIKDYSLDEATGLTWCNKATDVMLSYEQYLIGEISININVENADIQEVRINGHTGLAALKETEDGEEIMVVWNDNVYDYYLSTMMSLDETLLIAESIR